MSEPTQIADLGIDHSVVLILVGLIASGKSTFAEALQLHFPQFRRCNQDELGDRRCVETAARHSLQQGLSVCVDRTNADASQRAHWINIAREFPGTPIWVLFFDTPYYVHLRRTPPTTYVPHPLYLAALADQRRRIEPPHDPRRHN
ncbi:hypothetical protein EWM64_g8745, partial [Hericium alpestre]